MGGQYAPPNEAQGMKKANLLVFVLLAVAGSPVSAAQDGGLVSKIDPIFQSPDDTKAPGYAVAIVENGKVVFQKGYGLASLEYEVPFTPETAFNTASLSKQFTGLAISLLVQDGKVDLDQDIRTYVPAVPAFGKEKITVRQLLHHTSGIRDCYDVLGTAGWRWNDTFTYDDCMQVAISLKAPAFAPGTRYSYSNTEYVLLQAIVAAVTGKSFPAWATENVFKPIGMNSTFFVDDRTRIVMNPAAPYSRKEDGFHKDIQQNSGVYMLSTLRDLSKWAIHFNERLAAKDPVYTRMVEPGRLGDGKEVPYGFGLMLGQDRGQDMVFHTGAWGGYRANIRNYPGLRLSIIALSNTGDNDMNGKKVPQVAALFLKESTEPAGKAGTIKDAPTVKADPAVLKRYAGTYRWNEDAITIALADGRLMVQYLGEDAVPAEAKSDSEFWVPAFRTPISFAKEQGDNAYSLTFRSVKGEKVATFLPNRLDAYSGAYYSEELTTAYKVDAKDGKLRIHHFRRGDSELLPHPAYQDRFTSEMGVVQFVRNGSGSVTALELSGLRFARNL